MSIKSIIVPVLPNENCFKSGLKAIKSSEKRFFCVSNPGDLNGSVDIDTCLKSKYPTSNRWDYVIGYCDYAYFVEVHPASTSEVDKMIKKLKWLQKWMKTHAVDLKSITKGYYWLATGKIAIAKGSPQARNLAASGLSRPSKKILIK